MDESKEGTTCVVAKDGQGCITFERIDRNYQYSGIQLRVAGGIKGGKLTIEGDGQALAQLDVPDSEAQQWSTVESNFATCAVQQLTIQLHGTVKLSGFQLKS